MSFFLVDDGFSSHEKVSRLLDDPGRPDRGHIRAWALSLWVLAGSECARRRNGGRVSRALARTLLCTTGRVATQAADALIEAGLWERDGEGYVFHDWAERQRHNATSAPTASQQRTRSEPVANQQQSSSDPVAVQQRSNSDPVARQAVPTIPGTCDTTPLSSLLSPLSSSSIQERERERDPSRQVEMPEYVSLEPGPTLLRDYVHELERHGGFEGPSPEKHAAAARAAAELTELARVRKTTVDALTRAAFTRWFGDPWAKSKGFKFALFAKQAPSLASAVDEPARSRSPARASPRGMAPPASHAEFERIVHEYGGEDGVARQEI